jgi:hypothetical protein
MQRLSSKVEDKLIKYLFLFCKRISLSLEAKGFKKDSAAGGRSDRAHAGAAERRGAPMIDGSDGHFGSQERFRLF